ncbi:MAG: histidine phosphatase family protein [Oscillatoriales cyanobacterium C42_A2020_001]|nr:histidine phosphatase family protein [Leptolyngbyaceae cyanobacterium C42_A2020_001]
MKWTIVAGISTLLLIWHLSQEQPIHASNTDTTWKFLQQEKSGAVVLIRHAEAPGTGDPPNFRLNDCSTQRNLSAGGRSQAITIGQVFRRRNIRVTRVLSSQWCRCLDTARLLNLAPVEPFSPLNSFFQNPSAEQRQTRALRNFLIEQQKTQGVTILVTHQVNITALTNIFPQQGEMIVLQPLPNNPTKLVGRIRI